MGDLSSTDSTGWLPRISQTRCNGCGECIDRCPTGALGWQADKAALLQPDLCRYCATCEELCPVSAIELPYLVILKNKGTSDEQPIP